MTISREIGSEFHTCNTKKDDRYFIFGDWDFFLTGRTALDNVVKNIKSNKNVETALLPAYCCHSMVEPFIRNGINVTYYDVDLLDNDIFCNQEINGKFDIILLMNYFGINVKLFAKQVDEVVNNNKDSYVIVDITHALFSPNMRFDKADYYFCSLRKWTGLFSGGMALKNNGHLETPKKSVLDDFVSERKIAMRDKALYLKSLSGDKKVFLERFERAENLIDCCFEDYPMDFDSKKMFSCLDVEYLKRKRRENYSYLIDQADIFMEKGLKPLCYNIYDDVPLTFPVMATSNELRNSIRAHLISNNIFCPVHWPLPENVTETFKAHTFSKRELSIVCDQRYNIEDMKRIISVIKEFNE